MKQRIQNLNGFCPLVYLFFPKTSMFLRRIICPRFVEKSILRRENAFSFWKPSSAKFEGWNISRGSLLSCSISPTVSSQWASFEFPLIDFLWFQLFPPEQRRFYRLKTWTAQGVLGPWVSSFYFGREVSLRLMSEECLTLPSSNQIFHDQ